MPSVPNRQHLIAFLNALPTAASASEWFEQLIAAVQELFPEIDHVIVIRNSLDARHRHGPLNGANVSLLPTDDSALGFDLRPVGDSVRERIEIFMEMEMKAIGRKRSFFHAPTILTSYDDGAWLGTFIMLRERKKPAFSEATLKTLAALEPFFIFVFKDYSMRYHAEHPADTLFYDAMEHITEELGLTHQAMRVLMYRLLGRSYKEIGTMLGISAATVRNHLNTIHRKAGVNTQGELFARYFAPEFGLLMKDRS